MPDLRHVGFDLADEGEGRYRVNGIPAQLEAGSASDLLHHVLADARAVLADPARRIRESIAASLATADSLKPGQPLTNEEMSDLIDRLFASSNPQLCPPTAGKSSPPCHSKNWNGYSKIPHHPHSPMRSGTGDGRNKSTSEGENML